MKSVYKAIAFSLVLMPLALAVQAEEKKSELPKHEMQPEMGMHQGMPMHEGMQGKPMHGMMGMHEDMMSPEHLKEKQAHILLMHDLSNKILAEKDPKKQQALKDQQLEVMKAHMKAMMEKRHKMKMAHPAPPPATPAPEATKK